MSGKLVTIVGVMGSGKTEKLIDMYKDFVRRGITAMIFKPTRDTRTSTSSVQSRSGAIAPATPVQSIEDIYEYEGDMQSAILIDEVQFFDQPDLVNSLMAICLLGIDVYCYGLDLTSDGTTFGRMGDLMAQSDEVIKLESKCSRCENNARISSYTGNDKTTDVKVGDLGEYEPLCRDCYYPMDSVESETAQSTDSDSMHYFQLGGKSAGFQVDLRVRESSLKKAGYDYHDVSDIQTLEGAKNLLQDLGLLGLLDERI